MSIREELKKGDVKYRLVGTVNHFGSLNQGHYFAEVRNHDGNWYEINDEVVRNLSRVTNSSKYVYILFY